ncbi:hypothetical protein, partial [Klebsiella aerogenes]|uniref:hypothetical protein n=1 Tax=Klebsiella aerogenes TaxID=548 RepID=UPI001BD6A6E8
MPQAVGAAVIGEVALATGLELTVGALAQTLVGYGVLGNCSLGLTFTAIPDEETARDGAERDPAVRCG